MLADTDARQFLVQNAHAGNVHDVSREVSIVAKAANLALAVWLG
jgi:hypothetical protein